MVLPFFFLFFLGGSVVRTYEPIAIENQVEVIKQYVKFEKRTRIRKFLKNKGYFVAVIYGKYLLSLSSVLRSKPSQDLLYQVYDFDFELRSLLFKYCNKVEIQFKNHVANAVAIKTSDATFYLDVYNENIYTPTKGEKDKNTRYKNKKYFEKVSKGIVYDEKDIRRDTLKYPEFNNYRKGGTKYRQKIPAWAYFSKIDFGSFINIYSYLNLAHQKNVLAYGYSSKRYDKSVAKNVDTWLNAIRVLRNICAHNSKLVGIKSAEITIDKDDDYNLLTSKEDLFSRIYALKKLLNCEDGHKLKTDLIKLIKGASFDIYAMRILPSNWEEKFDNIKYL